jgi:hypothetical protein
VNAIMIGMAGKWDMLESIFGSNDEVNVADLPEAGAGMLGRQAA